VYNTSENHPVWEVLERLYIRRVNIYISFEKAAPWNSIGTRAYNSFVMIFVQILDKSSSMVYVYIVGMLVDIGKSMQYNNIAEEYWISICFQYIDISILIE